MGQHWSLLRRYVAPQRGAVALMAIFLLGSTAMQLGGPQIARGFVDAAQAGAEEAALLRSAILFLAVTVAYQVARVLAGYWSEHVGWTATNALRADLTDHLVRLDRGFHATRTPGDLIERVDGDVSALGGFFSAFVVRLVGSALLLIGVVVAVWFVHPLLGLAFAAFVAVTLAVLSWVRTVGAPHWRADRQHSAAFYGYLGEVLGAAEDVRSSGAVPYALGRFFAGLHAWWPDRFRAGLWGQAVMMAGIVAFALGDAVAYGLGGALHREGAISLGAVYLVVAYAAMLAAPIETIRTQLQELQRADAGVARVQELLALRPAIADPIRPVDLPDGPLPVELRGVRFGYEPGDPVLDGVSLSLAPGRVLGLLGHTGSGKTTLARLLFRFHDPQEGEVLVGDVDVRGARLVSLRARVGLVTQDVQLFSATLRDNITFFDPGFPDAWLRELIDALGLAQWLARQPEGLGTAISPGRLSAGEAQLVALARVFLRDPGLVVLDEPSSRLDPATEALLETALDRLLTGRTVVLIAHRLETLGRADELVILDAGRVVEHGPRAALAADRGSRFSHLQRTDLAEVLV